MAAALDITGLSRRDLRDHFLIGFFRNFVLFAEQNIGTRQRQNRNNHHADSQQQRLPGLHLRRESVGLLQRLDAAAEFCDNPHIFCDLAPI